MFSFKVIVLATCTVHFQNFTSCTKIVLKMYGKIKSELHTDRLIDHSQKSRESAKLKVRN